MNKKLVAVALAGPLAAPLAQAQTANVTLYGRANLDMEVVTGHFLGALYDTQDLWGNNSTLLTSILEWSEPADWQLRRSHFKLGSLRNAGHVRLPGQDPIQYGAGGPNNEGTPKTNAGVTSGVAFYNNGLLKLGAGFEMNNSFRAAGLNDLAWSVVGGWQFPNVYVGGIYEKLDYDVQ